MPLRSRVTRAAAFAAFVSLCAGGVGCQSNSLGVMHTGTASQPVRDYIRELAGVTPPPPPIPEGTVIASSSPLATLARPTAPASLPGGMASSWEPVKRVNAEKIASTPSSNNITRVSTPPLMGGAVRAALDIPVPQPAAPAPSSPKDPAPAQLKQPRLEPQAVVAAPPPIVLNHPAAPREFAKQPLPPYVVEPPDILLVSLLPTISLTGAPVEGNHLVRPDGTIGVGV